MTFGEKIKELRKSKKLSLQELSEKSNVNVMTLSKLENNSKPSALVIGKIAKALDYDIEELWKLANNQEKEKDYGTNK